MHSTSLPHTTRVLLVMAFLIIAGAGSASAQSHSCSTVADARARLACYDRAYPPAAGNTTDPGDDGARREEARKNFGLTSVQQRAVDPASIEREVDAISAAVTRIAYVDDGQRVVTLDNGQVWRLVESSSRGRLESGDRVKVRKAALGSFMLVTPRDVALRAKRVR